MAGSSGEDVDGIIDGVALFLVIHSAEDGFAVETGVFAERLGVFFDLHGEFTGGFENENPAGSGLAVGFRIAEKTRHGGGEECRCFSGSGLRLSGEVASFDGVGETFFLDDGTVFESELLGSGENLFCKVDVTEAFFAFRGFDVDQFGHRESRLGGVDRFLRLRLRSLRLLVFRFVLRFFRLRFRGLLRIFCAVPVVFLFARLISAFSGCCSGRGFVRRLCGLCRGEHVFDEFDQFLKHGCFDSVMGTPERDFLKFSVSCDNQEIYRI